MTQFWNQTQAAETFANVRTVYTVVNISKAAAPQMCVGNRNVLGTLSKVHNPCWFHRGIGFLQMERPFTRGLGAPAPAVSGSHDIWSVGMTRVWQRPRRHRLHSHRAPNSDDVALLYREGLHGERRAFPPRILSKSRALELYRWRGAVQLWEADCCLTYSLEIHGLRWPICV